MKAPVRVRMGGWVACSPARIPPLMLFAYLSLGIGSCPPKPPTPIPTPTPTPSPTPTPGGPQFLDLLVRTDGVRLTRGGQPWEPFGAIQCCMPFQTASRMPRKPAPLHIKGQVVNSRWPLASEAWMDYTGAKGANFYHFRLAPWYGDVDHEIEWADIGGPMLGDGPDFNPAFWSKAVELAVHAGNRKANVEVAFDTWLFKHCQWGDQPCAWPQEDIDAAGRRSSPGQEQFLRKMVSELGCFGNVVWITDNEGGEIQGTTREWYEWVRNVIRDEEQKSGCGIVHLVGTNNTNFCDGPFDYCATHANAPLGVIAGKHTENNERNGQPQNSPELEHSRFCQARGLGLHYWFWRAEMTDQQMDEALALFKQGCGAVQCFAPDPEDPLWGANITGAGQMKSAVEAAKSAVGEHCGTDHQGSLATLGLVADELRKQGYCASGPWTDAVAILAPDGWWEEYHAVSFATGCWAQDPGQLPKFRWWYTGTNPTPPGTCPSPLPDRSKLLWRLNCGTWCDATPTLHNDCGYCTSIGLGTMPDGVTPRCDCPARNECPDVPGYEGMCDDRLTCERYLIEAEAPVWHTDGTLVMDPNSAWRARQTGGTYLEACNGGSTKCTRVVQ